MLRIALAVIALAVTVQIATAQPATVRLQQGSSLVGSGNPLYVTGPVTPSGTQDVNIKQYNGATVGATNPEFVAAIPSSSSLAGIAPSATQAAASNSVLKGSAGILRSLTVTIGATAGWVMVFDATTLPGNGATTTTLKWCYPVNSDGTKGGIDKDWNTPLTFTTGITVGFSSTACNSLTASATAFFYGEVQ